MPRIIRYIIYYLFKSYTYGFGDVEFRAYLLYCRSPSFPAHLPECHSEEEISGIIEAVNRVNLRWPGTFIAVNPPRPKPEDRNQVIWILDYRAFWPERLGDPSEEDIIRVALGETPIQ